MKRNKRSFDNLAMIPYSSECMMKLFRTLSVIIFIFAGLSSLTAQETKDTFTVHYHRTAQDYEGWGLYVWGSFLNLPKEVTWGSSLMPVNRDDFGVIWRVGLKPSASKLSFILHLGEQKNTPKDVNITLDFHGYEVWVLESDPTIYTTRPKLASDKPVSVPAVAAADTSPILEAPKSAPEKTPVQITPTKALPTPGITPPRNLQTTELVNSVALSLLREKDATDKLAKTELALENTKIQLSALQKELSETPSLRTMLMGLAALGILALIGIGGIIFLSLKLKTQKNLFAAQSVNLVQETETRVMSRSVVDELTGLPNRGGMNQALPLAISKARRYKKQLALIFIDLDHFKPINDNLGHEAGDFVLKTIAERFKDCLRESDLITRIGGDEFVVLIEDLVDAKFVGGVAQKLLAAASKGFVIGSQEVHVSASIGIATFPQDGSDTPSILRAADAAMYKAKEKGRNNFQFYSQELNTHSLQRLALESSLQNALSKKEFHLVYQPIVHLTNQRILGVEALLRWTHPDMGEINPLQFIPLAEENGNIHEIGAWVMENACRQARKWLGRPLSLTINISSLQLQRANFVQELKLILDKSGFPAQALILDITEEILMINQDQATEVLHSIRDLGIRIALDDFGTGYSSLAHLKRFPIDILKIDQSLLVGLPGDEDNKALTSAIIALGDKLGLEVIAEGVETQEQKEFLASQNCSLAQGFLLQKPLSPEEITKLL